jgi:hypothetical protein
MDSCLLKMLQDQKSEQANRFQNVIDAKAPDLVPTAVRVDGCLTNLFLIGAAAAPKQLHRRASSTLEN